ncbi:uncharacterized protein LOC109840352 isoform X1 [Asparagus officinalis]|uniref:uncharacterized protein LOC109840352 isoform X1 n=1 Tax=Asparagus officinalis TaxID=4686 RepID=UPI00098DF17F|nr:uncharacterized protein LOC109840352 isoform X1 [Asparagus officinalis]
MAEEEPISSRGFSVLNRQRFDDLWRKRSLSRVFCPKSSKIRRSMVREELISSDFKVNSPILKFPSLDPWWGSTSKKIKVGKGQNMHKLNSVDCDFYLKFIILQSLESLIQY